MFHGEAPGNAGATVMSDDCEFVEAERAHHFNLIQGYCALRVIAMVLPVNRLAAVAVTSEIRHNNREEFRQARRDLVPHDMRLRITVEKQEGRAAAGCYQVDARTRCCYSPGSKSCKQARFLRLSVARHIENTSNRS